MNANLQIYNKELLWYWISKNNIWNSTFHNGFYVFLCHHGAYCSIMVKPGSGNVISNIVVDLLVVDIFYEIKNNATAKWYLFK